MRLRKIFQVLSSIMKARQHTDLVKIIRSELADVFGYEFAAILFNDRTAGNLYAFTNTSKANDISHNDQVLTLPSSLGLTGEAIRNRKAMFFENGEDDPLF